MKKRLINSLTALLLIVVVAQTGCNKDGSPQAPVSLPNIADFTITGASAFGAGATSTVNVSSASIGSGTYTVYFNITGANTLLSQSSPLVMSNGTGSFQTPDLTNPGPTYLTLNSITNINGGGTSFPANDIYTLSDSIGLMTATIGSTSSFYAANVLATITGTALSIRGEVDEPNLTSITLIIDSFTNQTEVINFSSYNVPEIAHAQYTSSTYPHGGNLSAHGTINITSISPLISGTFSFTLMDSTQVTGGSFSAVAPSN